MSKLSDVEKRHRDQITQTAQEALRWAQNVTLILDPSSAVILIAQLQLALRHPHNTGPSAQISRKIINGLIERLPEGSHDLLKLGFDPRFDI